MVSGPGRHGEKRRYANRMAAYVRPGAERFLGERRRDAENGALALSMRDEL